MQNNFNLPKFNKMQPSKCLFNIYYYELNHVFLILV